MSAFYNEIDPYAAQWLRNLIKAGHIADGVVDERSILDLHPEELREFAQCHFFAGIGVWSHALRLAQWPDTRPVWTGSCPCQPFSVAGRSAGVLDQRHLWPHWFWLIEQCRPAVIFGEQVEAAIGHGWLDLVQSDLEGIHYAVGHAGLPAGGVGAPHMRKRLWFVADSNRGAGRKGRALGAGRPDGSHAQSGAGLSSSSVPDKLAHHHHQGLEGGEPQPGRQEQQAGQRGGAAGELGHTQCVGAKRDTGAGTGPEGGARLRAERDGARSPSATSGLGEPDGERPQHQHGVVASPGRGEACGAGSDPASGGGGSSPADSFWRDADWLLCRDGKWRPVEPGTFPLAHGAAARVGRLRAYGNAIVPQVAAEVIAAFMECRP